MSKVNSMLVETVVRVEELQDPVGYRLYDRDGDYYDLLFSDLELIRKNWLSRNLKDRMWALADKMHLVDEYEKELEILKMLGDL